jgi:putative FmdB family regulatory protein
MPIYEYACSACGKRTEILHGIHDPAPAFCPECGAEGTLRTGFAAPAVVFKGSGWAKKDRRATSSAGKSRDDKDGSSESKSGASKSADSGASSDSSGSASVSTDKPAAKASEGA